MRALRCASLAPSPWRDAILATVAERPGILQAELSCLLGCNRGTLRHHLETLARHGLVHLVCDGQRSAVFPVTLDRRDQVALAVLQRGRTAQLADCILANPGITQSGLCVRLGMSRKLLRKYADRLTTHGLVVERLGARCLTYHATEALQRLMPPQPDATDEAPIASARPLPSPVAA